MGELGKEWASHPTLIRQDIAVSSIQPCLSAGPSSTPLTPGSFHQHPSPSLQVASQATCLVTFWAGHGQHAHTPWPFPQEILECSHQAPELPSSCQASPSPAGLKHLGFSSPREDVKGVPTTRLQQRQWDRNAFASEQTLCGLVQLPWILIQETHLTVGGHRRLACPRPPTSLFCARGGGGRVSRLISLLPTQALEPQDGQSSSTE